MPFSYIIRKISLRLQFIFKNITRKANNMLKDKILKELENRFQKNNWKPIQIQMKSTQETLLLTACSYCESITRLDDVEWILVEGSVCKYLGGLPEEVADRLARYDELIKENENDKNKCRLYFEKYIKNKDTSTDEFQSHYEFYSDWHKDIFGFRPSYDKFGTR